MNDQPQSYTLLPVDSATHRLLCVYVRGAYSLATSAPRAAEAEPEFSDPSRAVAEDMRRFSLPRGSNLYTFT